MDYQHALAAIVEALNDVGSDPLIDDPRQGAYRVAFGTSNMKEAMERAKQLARIGIIPRTSIEHDSFGTPIWAQVTIYANGDHKHLFECTQTRLCRDQRQRFVRPCPRPWTSSRRHPREDLDLTPRRAQAQPDRRAHERVRGDCRNGR